MSRELEEFLKSRVKNPKQKEFFDQHAVTWDVGAYHDPEKIRYILEKADVRDGMDVLDVGTGTGVMMPYYQEVLRTGTVTGLDYSENMISEARRKYPESGSRRYVVADLYEMDADQAYDRVVCYSCFPHFPDPVGAVEVLTRALRHGGSLCVAHSDSAEFINSVHRDGGEEIHTDYLPPMKLMIEIFDDCGLETTFARDDDQYYIITGKKH